MQPESPREARAAGSPPALTTLRREAAALQQRAAQLTAASAQVERRLAELVARRAGGTERPTGAARIAELRELGRESVRLLEAAVRRREALRRRIEELERAQVVAPQPRPAGALPAPPPTPAPAPAIEPAPTIEPASTIEPAPAPALTDEPGPASALAPVLGEPAAPTAAAALPSQPDTDVPIRRHKLERLRQPRWLMPARLFTALHYSATALLGALLLVLAFLLTPLPELFGWQVYAVQSGSMEPAIPLGSLIAVQPVRAGDLKVGDVITFSERTRPDVRVTHRIVSLETKDGQQLAVTKGDANNTTDSWNVPLSEAIGRVVFHLPYMGYALAILSSTPVKLAALALAGLMLSLPSLRRRFGRGAAAPVRVSSVTPDAPPFVRVAQPTAAQRVVTQPQLRAPASPVVPRPAEPPPPLVADDDEPLDEADVSFDALASEIDALLGRIAAGETPSSRGARTGDARGSSPR